MDAKPESPKDPFHKKVYVAPRLKRILLDNEGLLEYCKGKPYNVQELKEVIKEMLTSS